MNDAPHASLRIAAKGRVRSLLLVRRAAQSLNQLRSVAADTASRTTIAYSRPERRTRVLLGVDFAVTACLLLSTAALQYPQSPRHGVAPITATWLAGPVLAWAVRYGRRAGAIASMPGP